MYVVGSFTGTDGPDKFAIYNPGNTGPRTLIAAAAATTSSSATTSTTTSTAAPATTTSRAASATTPSSAAPARTRSTATPPPSRCTYYSCKIPYGNDVINARDGEADNIDCGIGEDKAIVDAIDVVANCETVDGGGSNGGPARAGGSQGRAEVHVRAGQAGQVRGQGPEGQGPLRRRVHRLGHGDGRQGDRAQARHQEDRLRQGQGEQGAEPRP